MTGGHAALGGDNTSIRTNYTLTRDQSGAFSFRLRSVPVDELTVAQIFLAVQEDINAALHADGRRPWSNMGLAGSNDIPSRGSTPHASITAKVSHAAHELNAILAQTREIRAAGLPSERTGDERSVVIETLGGATVTVLWVAPRYLMQLGADQFEVAFNKRLNAALRATHPIDGRTN